MRFVERIARWWRGGDSPFTVACDLGPFWTPFNERERLFHTTGIRAARRIARRWVREHGNGQARIIPGTHEFERSVA